MNYNLLNARIRLANLEKKASTRSGYDRLELLKEARSLKRAIESFQRRSITFCE